MARSTLARHRRSFILRDPNEGGGGGGTNTGGEGGQGGGADGTNTGGDGGGNNGGQGGGGNSDKTFSQADVDRIVGDRLARQKSQFADYDALKADSVELARLRQENESETEKKVREAREQAAAEERARVAPQAVRAEFRAAAKGVLTDAQRDAFLEDADLSKYLKEDGSVDTDKVESKVKALAPEKTSEDKDKTKTKTTGRVPRDNHQGNRSEGGKASVSSSREDYLERRKKQLGLT